jgi:hypothetical protein
MIDVILKMEVKMSAKIQPHSGKSSWLGRLCQGFVQLGEAIEMSEAERLERRVAALEAAASNARERVG